MPLTRAQTTKQARIPPSRMEKNQSSSVIGVTASNCPKVSERNGKSMRLPSPQPAAEAFRYPLFGRAEHLVRERREDEVKRPAGDVEGEIKMRRTGRDLAL